MSLIQIDRRPPHDPATCSRTPCGRCSKPRRSTAPAIGRNPHDAEQTPAAPDPVIAAHGLPAHPDPAAIADAFEEAAKALRSRGFRAIDLGSVLASKGYSARTLGDGGSRGTDTTSSTERLASQPDRWDAVDHAYAALLRLGWSTALHVQAMTDELVRHASDDDETPAGQGECRACARFVKRVKDRPSYRLRSGLCPSCFGAWSTYRAKGGLELWSEWVSKRREGFTERNASGQIVAVHTPEPEQGWSDAPTCGS